MLGFKTEKTKLKQNIISISNNCFKFIFANIFGFLIVVSQFRKPFFLISLEGYLDGSKTKTSHGKW